MTTVTNRPDWMLDPATCPHNEIAYSGEVAVWCETCGTDLTEGEPSALDERFDECEEWNRDAFKAWHASGDYVADGEDLPDLSAFYDQYAGNWDSFREFANDVAEEHVLSGGDAILVRYFDYDLWARDLAFDYWTAPDEHGGVFVFRNA